MSSPHLPRCGCHSCVAARHQRIEHKTLAQVAEMLSHPTNAGLVTKPHRTLPVGYSWSGHDIPGRGSAASRRLRQLQKLSEKKARKAQGDAHVPIS